jgi:hypothetical protein
MKPLPVVASFEVRFNSLFSPGRALAFPCDASGRVDLDALSERARSNYLFARAMVGREHAMPCVCPLAVPEQCLQH